MKKTLKLLSTLFCVLSLFILTGCDNSKYKKYSGKWINEAENCMGSETYYLLNPDKTCTEVAYGMEAACTWDIKKGTITEKFLGMSTTMKIKFLDNNTMELSVPSFGITSIYYRDLGNE